MIYSSLSGLAPLPLPSLYSPSLPSLHFAALHCRPTHHHHLHSPPYPPIPPDRLKYRRGHPPAKSAGPEMWLTHLLTSCPHSSPRRHRAATHTHVGMKQLGRSGRSRSRSRGCTHTAYPSAHIYNTYPHKQTQMYRYTISMLQYSKAHY